MRYVFYDNTLEECTKPSDTSTIGHACIGDDTGGYPETKIEDFAPGRESAICQIIDCDAKAVFGIKDGSMCDDAGAGGGGGFFARLVFHVEENRERHASGPIQLRPATTITTTNITTNE